VSESQKPELSVCLIERIGDQQTEWRTLECEELLGSLRGRHEVVSIPFAPARTNSASCNTTSVAQGYRAALAAALERSSGDFLVTTDSYLSADLHFLLNFWALQEKPDLAIASRFAPGGIYRAPFVRRTGARIANRLARRVLSLPYWDLTSAFRMYRREALELALEHTKSSGYEFLPESIVHLHGLGRVIEEIPYVSRRPFGNRVNVPGRQVGWPLIANLPRLWRVRNSVFSADYDDRAFNSLIWPQRYWQRKRFEIITSFVESPAGMLDIGCGSSKIIQAFPGAVGLDIQLKKLRFLFRRRTRFVQGSAFRLPFANSCFRTVICSEVIEHIPFAEILFDEFRRILGPNGILILGTPDYGTWTWPTIEWFYGKLAPGGYAHEHITHYTADQLVELLRSRGFVIEESRRICGAELILKARLGTRVER